MATGHSEGCYKCGAYPNNPRNDTSKLYVCKVCKFYTCSKHTAGGMLSGKKCPNCDSSKLRIAMRRVAAQKIAKGGMPTKETPLKKGGMAGKKNGGAGGGASSAKGGSGGKKTGFSAFKFKKSTDDAPDIASIEQEIEASLTQVAKLSKAASRIRLGGNQTEATLNDADEGGEAAASGESDKKPENKAPQEQQGQVSKAQSDAADGFEEVADRLKAKAIRDSGGGNKAVDAYLEKQDKANPLTTIIHLAGHNQQAMPSVLADGMFRVLADDTLNDFLDRETRQVFSAKVPRPLFVLAYNISTEEGADTFFKIVNDSRYIFAAIGYGPEQAADISLDEADDTLTIQLNRHEKIVALGPIGLDKPQDFNGEEAIFAKQTELLHMQLDIAEDFQVAVLLTHRQAARKLDSALKTTAITVPLIYSDVLLSARDIEVITAHDMYVLVRPELTHQGFNFYCDALAQMPLNRLILASGYEAIAPKQSAQSKNSPLFALNTAKALALIHEVNPLDEAAFAEFLNQLNQNFKRAFYGNDE